jgi:hypothetical protein
MRFNTVYSYLREIVRSCVIADDAVDLSVVEVDIWHYAKLSETSGLENAIDPVSQNLSSKPLDERLAIFDIIRELNILILQREIARNHTSTRREHRDGN